MVERGLIEIASLFVVCSLCQWVAWRVKLPAIIFLLVAGILAGPVFGILQPDRLMGDLFFPFVSLSVSIILFEGSLTLKFREILGLRAVVRNMISFGMLVTWLITAVTTRYAIGLSWELSFLFGAVTVVTGPTVIVPMLRTVRPTASVSNILRWEGIVIDPIGASLAVLVYEFIISGGGQQAMGHTLLTFGQIVLVGGVIGLCCGYVFGLILRHHWLPEFLHNVATLSLVFGAFALANSLQAESGLVTVTVMGILLANMKDVDIDDILDFKESLSILLISLLFIMLAARLDPAALGQLGWSTLVVFLAIQFLARPLNVMVSALGSRLTWPERHLLAWIAPRGIVAAAIAALFAIQLENIGFTEAGLLVPLTFSVIIGTVLLQSFTARPIAQWLGVAEPEPKGFLIVGANLVARAMAKALVQNGLRVLVADASRSDISAAKMDGIATYLGNPISEHADRHLDLVGIGGMLAITPHENLNVAAVMHYRMELGRNNVFMVQTKPADKTPERLNLPVQVRESIIFESRATYAHLASLLQKGGEIRTTKLTEKFSFDQFVEKQGGAALLLFAIDTKERFRIFTEKPQVKPGPGWSVLYLWADCENLAEAGEGPPCAAGAAQR
ncbi:MAG: cation:proton antiporter [Desulfobulbaceae bacterium]|nr:cation:proton antiporter [Desulfobulbaceae bacterium]HIJ78425.1 sodium:proton antiporter [Deltaproteobacteria bacterium]